MEVESLAEHAPQPPEADLLAWTTVLLVQSIDHERNPKFVNSQFLGLMKQLRDRIFGHLLTGFLAVFFIFSVP